MSNYPHEWRASTLGHGEAQCKHCFATNREIAVVGDLNHCKERQKKTMASTPPKTPINPEQVIQQALNQVIARLLEQEQELSEAGFTKELYLSALMFAVAKISKDLGVSTMATGIALSKARQVVDNQAPENMRPT